MASSYILDRGGLQDSGCFRKANRCPQSLPWTDSSHDSPYWKATHQRGPLIQFTWNLVPLPPRLLDDPRRQPPGTNISCSLFSPEQHAVQELTKAAMSGVGIDGEVLSYLELAQVCSNLPFTFSMYSTSSFNADKTFHCCIWTNKDVTTESQKPPAVCNRKDLRVLSFMHCSPCWASLEKTTRALPPHQPLCAPPLQRQQLHMWENSSGHGGEGACLFPEFSDRHALAEIRQFLEFHEVQGCLPSPCSSPGFPFFFLHQHLLLLMLWFHIPTHTALFL